MIQEKNNKSEEEKWDTISLFSYIPKSLYISMYKEGDAVKSMQLEYMGRN